MHRSLMAPVLFGSKLKVGGDPENRVLPTFSFRTENRTPICSYPVLENVLELCRGIGYLMHRRGKSKSPHYAPQRAFTARPLPLKKCSGILRIWVCWAFFCEFLLKLLYGSF